MTQPSEPGTLLPVPRPRTRGARATAMLGGQQRRRRQVRVDEGMSA
ncbi:hypothetical protein [Actinopolymorpha pittospori]|uniref:Uncharacterized protein n=1 Tax=Actinopolymorpha pittospori TaxID=648752 RepID=A0A927RJ06_9ACTN|nr:hypothetical protein [Actinopolymorpha pittospori]MBE1605118.1 hypothetical protein [Actinopolymorpha pittospori]